MHPPGAGPGARPDDPAGLPAHAGLQRELPELERRAGQRVGDGHAVDLDRGLVRVAALDVELSRLHDDPGLRRDRLAHGLEWKLDDSLSGAAVRLLRRMDVDR